MTSLSLKPESTTDQTQTIAVNIPATEPNNSNALQVNSNVTPAHWYCYSAIHDGTCGCWINKCDGSINLTVQGGSGDYSYQWKDCQCEPYATDSPNFDLCCASHTKLCHGCHTVTVTDNQTSCQGTRTFNVGLQVDNQTYYTLCDPNFGSTVGQTFTLATLDPKLQIYPSAFDVLRVSLKTQSYFLSPKIQFFRVNKLVIINVMQV